MRNAVSIITVTVFVSIVTVTVFVSIVTLPERHIDDVFCSDVYAR